jgi:hypothetical protein
VKGVTRGGTVATADVELTSLSEVLNPAIAIVALGLSPLPEMVKVLPL